MLAPSLRYVADSLALSWRRQLTAAAHARYLKHNNFYTVSQLAGMQACVAATTPAAQHISSKKTQ